MWIESQRDSDNSTESNSLPFPLLSWKRTPEVPGCSKPRFSNIHCNPARTDSYKVASFCLPIMLNSMKILQWITHILHIYYLLHNHYLSQRPPFLGQQTGKDFQTRSGFRGSSIDEGHCDLRYSEGPSAPLWAKTFFPWGLQSSAWNSQHSCHSLRTETAP